MLVGHTCSSSFGAGIISAAAVIALVVACSSSDSTTPPPGGDGGGATCASPGMATPGPADTHCQGQSPQPVDPASCHPDAGVGDAGNDGGADDGGSASPSCDYGDTMYGQSGNDDDCKYTVSWTSDPICEGVAGVQFTLTVKSNVDGAPITGIPDGIIIEAYIPTTLDASCDNTSTHASPGTATLMETAAGSGVYKGPIVFDAPGEWTVRFHIHEECEDLLPTSQHGHAAFHITVP